MIKCIPYFSVVYEVYNASKVILTPMTLHLNRLVSRINIETRCSYVVSSLQLIKYI